MKPNKMLWLWMGMVLLIASFTLPACNFASADNMEMNIQDYVQDMQPGWNLGNTFDAVGEDETAWGNPRVTQQFIQKLVEQGFKSIRIPVTFDQRMEDGPDCTIDEQFLSRLDQAITWSLDENLYVMINVHHDSWIWLESGMQQNHDETLARFEAIWRQLADRYADYSAKLMFESINEPRFWGTDEEKQAYLDELNTSFYTIVRNSGGLNDTRPLVLPTLDTGSDQHKIDALHVFIKELNDPNIIATVHYYGFWPFSVNIAGFTTFNEETKNDVITTFDRVHNTFVSDGIPVVIGEFGLLGFDTDLHAIQQGEKLKFFEFLIHDAQEKGLTHMLWDNGQHFGRSTYQWSDPELYDMMKASWTGRSAVAETDTIFIKYVDEVISDVELTFELNGNEFTELTFDGRPLVRGEDYEFNSNVLTLKASLIEELTASGILGMNAKLSAVFDQGKDWTIFVVLYDTPVLGNATGTTGDFKIPLWYNGDQLATMEAVYEDGSNAGPQDWTSFKEFAYTFKPNYEHNTLTLTPNFFNEVNDGVVMLTMHFWSGEVLDYRIVKNGDQVNGGVSNSTDDHSGAYSDDANEEANKKIVENSLLRPDEVISRAEFATMVGRMLQLSNNTVESTAFTDDEAIPDDAKPYIEQLAARHILYGYADGSFRPDQGITRAELAVILARALKLEGEAVVTSFVDQESIPDWAEEQAGLLVEYGIMAVQDNGTFAADQKVTYVEVVDVFTRVLDYVEQ